MHKRIFSTLLAAVLSISAVSAVFAADEVHPKVVVDDRLISFIDQEPIISENSDTLIPLRGVFEAMGATVTWNAEERSVMVKSKDNITRLLLKIDDSIMTKYTLTSITTVDSEEMTLSTAPRLMNERTMIPLRVVSENMGADVDWSDADKRVTIKTKEYKKFISANTASAGDGDTGEYNPKDKLPYLYIEADKNTVNPGEEITVNVKVANTDKIKDYKYFAGFSAAIYYDPENMEALGQDAVVGGEKISSTLGASNDKFQGNSVKYVYILMPGTEGMDNTLADGTVASFRFTPTTDKETTFSLSNRIVNSLGSDTTFLVIDDERNSMSLEDATEIYIDTTPITINAQK